MEKLRKGRIFRIAVVGFNLIAWLLIPNFVMGAAPQEPGISLIVPETATPGEEIIVRVESVGGAQVTSVMVGAGREGGWIGDASVLPHEFRYKVPIDVIGQMKVAAFAYDDNENIFTTEAVINVQTTATLQKLELLSGVILGLDDVIPNPPPFETLTYFGAKQHVAVQGHFSDGVTRDLSSPAAGTVYQSQDPKIVEVLPDGYLHALSEGTTQVLISHSGHSLTLKVEVDFVDPNPGERLGGGQGPRDPFVTYSGPIDLGGGETMPLPPRVPIDLPHLVGQIKFQFHNNTGLSQLEAMSDVLVGSVEGGSDPACAVAFTGNAPPSKYPPFEVVTGDVFLTLPPEGGKCTFLIKVASQGDRDTDRIIVNNPTP